MDKEDSVSVIISALDEEKNILPTVRMVKNLVSEKFIRYEIIIFNDGSSDKTGIIADKIAGEDRNIRVVHHYKPYGLGYVYKSGIKLAKMEYIILVTGDNEAIKEELEKILNLRGRADIIIPYTVNTKIRPFIRRAFSKIFVFVLNTIFGLRLRYYNGLVLHKRDIINSIQIKTDGFVYQAEALIKLIKAGYGFIEVGINIGKRNFGRSKAFSLKNIINVTVAIFDILQEVYLRKKIDIINS